MKLRTLLVFVVFLVGAFVASPLKAVASPVRELCRYAYNASCQEANGIRPLGMSSRVGVTLPGEVRDCDVDTCAYDAAVLSLVSRSLIATNSGPKEPLQTAIDEGRVKPGAPANHLNGAVAEEVGWRSSISNGEIGIQGPGKITATGPDYLTYDPATKELVVWDAKYSATGKSWPSGSSYSPPASWSSEISAAVSNYSGPGASQVQQALAQGRVVGRYFKYP